MSEIAKQRRVIVVGIPGVGKSTVVNELLELGKKGGLQITVANYGTVMMEEASRIYQVTSRDKMRKLPVEIQKKLQIHAAQKIKQMPEDFVIVDTHLFISTREGYWPGMPVDVLQELKPTNLVLVSAEPEIILRRREKDTARSRDPSTEESIERDLSVATSLLYTSSLICGCPALIVENPEGKAAETAEKIVKAVEPE
jgi:adenylate kinase